MANGVERIILNCYLKDGSGILVIVMVLISNKKVVMYKLIVVLIPIIFSCN